LCYADLRPAPPVPAPVPQAAGVAPVAPAAPAPVGGGAAYDPLDPLTTPLDVLPPLPPPPPAPVDPLTAPLAAVLGGPLAADPEAPATPTWPCTECGARSPIDAPACTTCGTPFGGRVARLDDARAVRQRRMLLALGAIGLFLVLLATFTFATTGEPPPKAPAPGTTVVVP
jgi:hypothetical protein